MIKIYYLHRGDNVPFYVGYTKHLKNRLNDHRRKKGNEVEIVEIDECLGEDKKLIETMYIQLFKNWGFNLENCNTGGGGPSFHNEESIEKYKQWRKDKKPMLGKKQSEETRKRKSDALKGRPKPEGFGDMMREVRLGIPKPEGTGEKISKALKGKPSKKAKTVLQYDLEGNFIAKYSNTLEAAAKTNSNSSTISKVCRGIFSQTNNYKWSYE
jgi:group I intron endonuclease